MISGILDQVTISLQLNDSQKDRAKQSYGGVTDWLSAEGSSIEPYSPWLFPQGSLAQDTTVCPIARSEFDLDVICHVNYPRTSNPEDVFQLIWDRMHENGTYRPLMERLPRCIRLNYASESRFHLDIVPAIPDRQRGGTFILIPDGSGDGGRMVWKTSNPIGFREWLELEKAVAEFAEKRARVDPLDDPLPAERKAALTKSIQLFKRWRDVFWLDQPKLATPSIILTYLAATCYQGEGSLATAFSNILDGLIRFTDSGVREIYSPVNDREVISEKWVNKPKTYEAFVEGIRDLRSQWDEVLEIAADSSRGIAPLSARMKDIFGEPVTQAAKAALHQPVEKARLEKTLMVERSSGLIAVSSTPMSVSSSYIKAKPHTFFGD